MARDSAVIQTFVEFAGWSKAHLVIHTQYLVCILVIESLAHLGCFNKIP